MFRRGGCPRSRCARQNRPERDRRSSFELHTCHQLPASACLSQPQSFVPPPPVFTFTSDQAISLQSLDPLSPIRSIPPLASRSIHARWTDESSCSSLPSLVYLQPGTTVKCGASSTVVPTGTVQSFANFCLFYEILYHHTHPAWTKMC